MSGITVDTSDLTRLAASFKAVPEVAIPFVNKAMQVNARKIKDSWNRKLFRDGHAKRTGYSITYDITVRRGDVEAQIGAVTGSGRQAYITRLLEYGSVNNGPHGYGSAALDENTGDLESGLQRALADAERAAGL